jgi:membrane protein DedA with SNARE-associated domain
MSRTLFAGGSGAVGILPGTFAMFFVGAWISRLDTQTEVIFAAITGCVLAFIAGYVMPMGWGVYEFIRRYQRETGIQLLVDGD